MRFQQTGLLGFGNQTGVQTKDDVGRRAATFEFETAQQCGPIFDPHKLEVAAAVGLESRLDQGAGSPVGDERSVGIDRQGRCRRARR